ncbi:MAG: addiction module protein [Deltaproteobacteria bacterium]|nr:addiction module protein [Deltaproteobacteria bacterium]
MNAQLDRLLEEALKLPLEARGALAGQLIFSLDAMVDPGAEDAWEIEIAKRMKEIDSGAVGTIPWSQARKAILES